MAARTLSYNEFIEMAKKSYNKGGDGYVECWDERTFNDYVEMFGSLTAAKARKMFRQSYDIEKEQMAMMKCGW